jgi:hypothetical protein
MLALVPWRNVFFICSQGLSALVKVQELTQKITKSHTNENFYTVFKGMYESYCKPDNSTVSGQNCEERDRLFNNIYQTSSMLFAVCSFIVGIIQDRYGLLIVRLISTTVMSTGLLLMVFVEESEQLIWAAWPCIAIGGVTNHMGRILT